MPKREARKFKFKLHLSYPPGESVNDGISKEEVAVSYVSFNRAIRLVARDRQGALLAKSDIKWAFCLLPMHPFCFYLLDCKLADQK